MVIHTPNCRESGETSRDVICFSLDLTVKSGSIWPEGWAPKTMDVDVAQY